MKSSVRAPNELGQALKNERRIKGFTQAQLATLACVRPKTISAIENGLKTAELQTMFAIITALELDLVLQPRIQEGA